MINAPKFEFNIQIISFKYQIMAIEDCACEKRCAKNKISKCPGHLASKEAKKRMKKANRKA
jgi:hypothetical protein